MILKLATSEDKVAMLQILGWDTEQDYAVTPLLARLLSTQIPEGETAEVIIAKKMLQPSYRSNPSLLAKNILARTEGFGSCSGCEMPDPQFVKIAFYCESKPTRKFSHKFSMKGEIREWLESKTDGEELPPLTIDVKDIPESYQKRSEQLTYAVKREMGRKIRLRRMKTKWIISHEQAL